MKNKIYDINHIREINSNSLLVAIKNSKNGDSEKVLLDNWIKTLGLNPNLEPIGWYNPPPTGGCILIGNEENNYFRLNYSSLRNKETWSSEENIITEESIIYAYASPFSRSSAMIGDFGITLYKGRNPIIIDYLQKCLMSSVHICNFCKVGMKLNEVFEFAVNYMSKLHLRNEATSLDSGISNIGHTVPWSYNGYNFLTSEYLKNNNSKIDIRKEISNARVSINIEANLEITNNFSFTVEPQIIAEEMPLCSYHIIVSFIDGKKHIHSNFEKLFKEYNMFKYMEKILSEIQ